MRSDGSHFRLDEIADLNPRRTLSRGQDATYIDMAALPTGAKSIDTTGLQKRAFTSGSKFQNGDTLIARITPCLENGKAAFVDCLGNDEIAAGSTEFIVVSPKDPKDADFVYYLTCLPEFREFAISHMEGTSGRQRVSHHSLARFEFPSDALPTRHAISQTLKSIDDKIANNRALAADLEAMARAIFKSWFVDFDPVKAKMDGRAPAGMDAETAALFPDELVESELGLIPKGWVPSSIGDVADNVKSGVRADTIDPDEPYVALEHFEKACLSLFAHARGQDATSNKTRFEAGDLLFGKLRPYFHKVAIAPFDGVCSTDVLAIRPKSTQYASYTYCAFSNKSVVDYVTNLSGGTRMPRTNWKQLASYPAAIPPVAVANAFNLVAAPMLGFVADVGAENLELSRLRDILLPRLISGKLRLPDSSDQSLAEGD